MNPGCIVRCRERDWVLLPSPDDQLYALRPLTGGVDDVVFLHKSLSDLIAYSQPYERLESSEFPPPKSDHVADAASARLLWQAARLTLREGAAPPGPHLHPSARLSICAPAHGPETDAGAPAHRR